MAKSTFATLGIFAVLLLGLGLISATYITTENNVTLTIYSNSLENVSEGETYDFEVTIENNNASSYYVVFGTTGWTWSGDETNISAEDIMNFTGTLTIPESTGSKSVIAKFYNTENTSEFLFDLTKSISLTYAEEETEDPIQGCTDSDAINYNPNATEGDGSCEYPTTYDSFCEFDAFGKEKGHLEITSFEITNSGSGDDEEWEYLDSLEIEVTIENTDDDNIEDVVVEIIFQDEDGNFLSKKDIDLNDDEIELGRINDDDEETATFKIDELPIDLEGGEYKIYVRAYEENNEENECVSTSDDFTNSDETYFEFEIVESDGATIIVKKDLADVQASCGDENVEVRFMVYNTGSEDEEKVLITLENSKLGIYEKYIIDDLRDGKGKEAVFYIKVPEDVTNTFNKLEIYTYYDYDDDEDELDELVAYGESSEEEDDDFSVLLEILSCQAPVPAIAASLDSETIAGKELVIKTLITNNGNQNDFVISASDFESWADLVSVTPQMASIKKGEFQEVTIVLMPKVEGKQFFKINTIMDGETYSQPVSVDIKEQPGLFNKVSNTVLYLIIGIALLVVLILLTLIVKVSRRA